MPCECCGQRLPGEPPKAEQAKIDNEIKRLARYFTNERLALGLRAEGVPEKQIAKVYALSAGDALAARRRLRRIGWHDYAPGMVQRWGRKSLITPHDGPPAQ